MALNEAIDSAREFGDKIYGVPDFFQIDLSWGNLFNFLWETSYDEELRKNRFPWLTQLQHTTLLTLTSLFQSQTPGHSTSLQSLNDEFSDENNGLIGLYLPNPPMTYVYNSQTWEKWHKVYVTTNIEVRYSDYRYFKRFYEPVLNRSINQINIAIRADQMHPFFDRIDQPTIRINGVLHREKIQIHFSNGAALYIDGTWKHGGGDIPVEARKQLLNLGFLLPKDLEL
jgi:hypothetical protein